MSAYSDRISSLSPKVWYRFNETAGTPTNSGSLSTSSTFTDILLNEQTDVDGRCISFNGTTSVIKLPNWPSFSLFDDRSFTFETWFKIAYADTSVTGSDWYRPIFWSAPDTGGGFAIHIGTSKTQTEGQGNRGKLIVWNYIGTNRTYVSTETYADDTWHHLAVTLNTTSFKVYVDGTLKSSQTLSASPTSIDMDNISGTPINGKVIGAVIGSGDTLQTLSRFKGRIDELAIYDRELTSTEINDNFIAGSSVTFSDTPGTASSLFVHPAISTDGIHNAVPATANASFPDAQQTDIDLPTMLEQYMASLTLEQWFKFTDYRFVKNYGSGGQTLWSFAGDTDSIDDGGLQGSGAIKFSGTTINGGGAIRCATEQIGTFTSTEITDNNWVMGYWIKAEERTQIGNLFGSIDTNGHGLTFQINETGNIIVNIRTSSGDHSITSTNSYDDNKWHFIAARLNNDVLQLWVDNSSQGTHNITGNYASSFIEAGFSIGAETKGNPIVKLSQFFIGTTANIGTTELTNIYNAGTVETQASASMYQGHIVKFDNAFNNKVVEKNPIIYFRLDESTGNYFTDPSSSSQAQLVPYGSNVTQGEITRNRKGLKVTNGDSGFFGGFNTPAGTYTTNDEQTIFAYIKLSTTASQAAGPLVNFGSGGAGSYGLGLGFACAATTAYARIISFGETQVLQYTSTFALNDNKWHFLVGTKNGSTIKLYIDGVLTNTWTTDSHNLTDNGHITINANYPGGFSAATRNKIIDEIGAFNTEFSDQEVLELYQALTLEMDTTASSELVMPTITVGTGVITTVDVMTASSEMFHPQHYGPAMLAFAEFLHPNYGGNVVIDANYGHEAFIASAEFHMPGLSIGDGHVAVHLEANALMVHPTAISAGSISVPTAVAGDAIFVTPGIVTIKGARHNAEPMRSNAIFPLPPAYIQLADDDWYVRLYAGHFDGAREAIQATIGSVPNQSSTSPIQGGFLTFFDDVVNDITTSTTPNTIEGEVGQFAYLEPDEYSYDEQGDLVPLDTTGTLVRATTSRQSNTPQAILSTGFFDPFERKAVRITNIEFPFPGTSKGYSERPYNIEFSIKTTKSDQIISHGFYTGTSTTSTQRIIGVVGLSDGKLYLTQDTYTPFTLSVRNEAGSKTGPHPKNFTNRAQYLIGRANIADGNWHHVIIQQGFGNENLRTQIWVDGQLDKQIITPGYIPGIDGTNQIRPYILGFNSSDPLLYSDFQVSAWNFYPGRFIDSRSIALNYSAYTKTKPIKVEPFNATAITPQNHKAEGNRARALMLFFWPKTGVLGNNPGSGGQGTIDEGKYGEFDESTFDSSLTTLDLPGEIPQQYYGWDLFPLDVTGEWGTGYTRFSAQSDMLKDDVWVSQQGYRDTNTGARRYLDLMKDIDITQFDAIFFRNFPEQSPELDSLTREEFADRYFGLSEEDLYNDFIKSLRAAVDTGISLYVTNAKLAKDLGIIDTYEVVSDIYESDFQVTDTFVNNKFTTDAINKGVYGVWKDTLKNNKFRIVNTLENLTNEAGYIWKDWMYYQPDVVLELGDPAKPFVALEYKANGLQIGDEFIMSDTWFNPYRYEATPFNKIKAGKIIAAFSNTINQNGVEVENPYKNYATIIALEPGTNLAGKALGGKILVNFTERLSSYHREPSRDVFGVDLLQDEWINLAYNNQIITLEKKNELLSSPDNLDRRLEAAIAANNQTGINLINELKYWDSNGNYILTQSNLFEDGTGGGKPKGGIDDRARITYVNRVNKKGTLSTQKITSTGFFFTFEYSWQYPRLQVTVPSMLTRGFRWLSDKIVDEGTVIRVEAMNNLNAQMKHPSTVADKDRTVYASVMLAGGNITNAVGYTPTAANIAPLPFTADAKFGEFVKNIKPDVFVANATFRQDVRTVGIQEDEVVVYMIHVDPILYLREDVIK